MGGPEVESFCIMAAMDTLKIKKFLNHWSRSLGENFGMVLRTLPKNCITNHLINSVLLEVLTQGETVCRCGYKRVLD
jgi:PhoPQ-activated pathogenicity-related protein